ncbi:hypothetical protein ACFTZF_23285 [Streptomyces mirabilis]|uniref:hypothetical protein n=1 Tax=Streptomyces mirabilis TaxID=68239 RepID=UPI00362656D3
MARIRTIKPEAFVSESLAAVTLTAERTFVGLLTQADDQGRHRDHAAIITGQLWVLRPEHGPSDVETDLAQLADAGLICRYKGPDDKRYLHIVTWHQHQKINRPSMSRLPDCPVHGTGTGIGQSPRGAASPRPWHRQRTERSGRGHGALTEDALSTRGKCASLQRIRVPTENPQVNAGSWSRPGRLTEVCVSLQ